MLLIGVPFRTVPQSTQYMSDHLLLGRKGERVAQQYLEDKGYKVLAANWRFSRAEIDLVVKKENLLVFVEVKTRSSVSARFGRPEDAVNAHKVKHLGEAAAAYMRAHNYQWMFRFDIIGVRMNPSGRYTIRHLEDAFFPGL